MNTQSLTPAAASRLRRSNANVLASSITALMVTGGIFAVPQTVRAVDGSWNVNANGNWSATGSWLGGIIPNSTDGTASFIFDITGDRTVTVDSDGVNANVTIGNIVLEDPVGLNSASYLIGLAANSITLDTSSGQPTITVGPSMNSQNLANTGLTPSNGKKAIFNTIVNAGDGDGLLKNGTGYLAWRSQGQGAKNITGTMTIDGGMIETSGANAGVGAIVIRNGASLMLDFQRGTTTANQYIGTGTSTLTFGGPGGSGTITNSSVATTGNHSQSFGAVTLNTGTHQILSNPNGGTNSYTLGAITNNAHAALNFAKLAGAAGTVTFNIDGSDTNDGTGILGAWATSNGTDWAINDGTNKIGSYTGYVANTWGSNHTDVTTSSAQSAATTTSLRFNTATNIAPVVTLSGANVISSGGIIAAAQSPRITGGTLTSGGVNGDLFVHGYTGSITNTPWGPNAGGTASASVGLRIDSTIIDNGATPVHLVKAGTGVLTLGANNSYTGGTTLGAGTIIVGSGPEGSSTGSLGSGDILVSANEVVSVANNLGAYIPIGILAFNRSGTFAPANNMNATTNGGGHIAQYSPGTLVLNKESKLGGLIAQAGTIRLDFNAGSAPASELINSAVTTGPTTIHNGSLMLRSGGLDILGKDSVASTQSFGVTVLQGESRISLTPGATGGTATLSLGVLSRTINVADGGGTFVLATPANTAVKTVVGTANTLLTDVGAAYATINGTDWAAKDGTNANIVAVGSGTTTAVYAATTPTTISTLNADLAVDDPTISLAQNNASFRISKNTGASTVTLTAAQLSTGGILVSSSVGAFDATITGTGSLRSVTASSDLPIFQHNTGGKLTIGVPIVNNTTTNLIKGGAGDVELTALNTYTGRTYLNEAKLTVSGTGQIGSSGTRANAILVRNGELIIKDSAQVFTGTTASSIGQRIGDLGTLTVQNGGKIDVAADLSIGDVNAKGVLNVSNTAQVLVKDLFVGKVGYASGTVNQTGGSVLAANTPTQDWNLGGNDSASSAAVGTYNLSGAGSVLDTGLANFQVGRNGTGTFNQTDGTVRSSGIVSIGRFHSGAGTWTISGGTLDATTTTQGAPAAKEYLIVGEAGVGTLTVSGASTLVKARDLGVGHDGGFGTVTLSSGTIELTETAALTGGVQAGVVFGQATAPTVSRPTYGGVVNLNGGTLKAFGVSERSGSPASSTFNFNGGTLQAKGNNATFMQGLDTVSVKTGGAIVDSNSFSVTIGQAMTHDAGGPAIDGGLTKTGSGTLTVTGANTYTGPTAVSAGTLAVSNTTGSGTGTGSVSVSASGTLGGTGTIQPTGTSNVTVASGGTIAPGASIGTLTLNSGTSGATSVLSLTSGAKFVFELNNSFQSDRLALINGAAGDISFSGNTIDFTDLSGGTLAAGNYTLFTADVANAYSGLVLSGSTIIGGLSIGAIDPGYSTSFLRVNGNDIQLVLVPEPSSLAALLGGLGLVAGMRRFRRS